MDRLQSRGTELNWRSSARSHEWSRAASKRASQAQIYTTLSMSELPQQALQAPSVPIKRAALQLTAVTN